MASRVPARRPATALKSANAPRASQPPNAIRLYRLLCVPRSRGSRMDPARSSPDMAASRGEAFEASHANTQQLKDELEKKKAALFKLWDSYEMQERDIAALKDRIAFLEQEHLQKDNIIANLKVHTESKDG